MRYIIGMAAVLAVVLVACAQQAPVCSSPYILAGGKCCLDADNDSACDTKSVQPGQLDCSLCPPQFVTQKEEVIRYKYVCFNQSVVDDPEACGRITSNAHLFRPNEEQDPAYVKGFYVDPACRGKFQAAEVNLLYAQPPLNITLEVLDDPEGEFKAVASLPVKPELFYYVGFCLDCQNLIDLQLAPDQAYLIRAALQYEKFTVYTAEELLDPTPGGDIGRKICS